MAPAAPNAQRWAFYSGASEPWIEHVKDGVPLTAHGAALLESAVENR